MSDLTNLPWFSTIDWDHLRYYNTITTRGHPGPKSRLLVCYILITITLKVKVDIPTRPLTENFSGTGLLQSQLWWASLLCHHHDGGDGYKYGDGGGYDGGGGNHGDHEDKEGEKDECHAAILVVVNVIFGPQFLPWQKFSGTKLDFHQTSTEAGLEKRAQNVFDIFLMK